MQRAKRKLEHIKYALELGAGPASTHLADLRFLHNCLPELNPADINLSIEILGKRLRLPFFIDAVTGGTEAVTDLNRKLAQVAVRLGIGMAVGSQYGAVRESGDKSSYEVVREELPEGLVIANISALATPQQAQAAVDMLHADALEVHLNAAQELWMREGDKDYAGFLDKLLLIKNSLSVPVIVKETGCGIAAEQYALLAKQGVQYFDCAGAGGTNFPAIEAKRQGLELTEEFAAWGVPTCWSLLDAQAVLPEKAVLFGSGGVRNAADAVRVLALGADAVGITGVILKLVAEAGVEAAVSYLEKLAEELRCYLLLLGCEAPHKLRTVPLVITGATKDFIACRGYELSQVCKARR